jgi:RNA polymerase sigma-70 factor (ECF subfamily)
MKANNQSDEWLMGQVARGRRDCLEVLVRRHATPLLTYLTRMSGDKHRGEELLQDAFLAVWAKRKTYKLHKPFKAWLYAIATNQCRSSFRAVKGKETTSIDAHDTLPVSKSPSPSEAALGSERATIVTSAVADLPEQQRMVVTLRMWGGMSYGEIAETAGRTEATIRSHMHRALESLRKQLTPVLANE